MNPVDLQYVKSHEWIRQLPNGNVQVGITEYAQKAMGDIVFANLPEVGASVEAGSAMCDIESVKSVEDVFSPVTGTVAAVNDELGAEPAKLNADPYGAWIAEITGVTGTEETMDAAAYEAFCASQEG